jgi:hypothetical protein
MPKYQAKNSAVSKVLNFILLFFFLTMSSNKENLRVTPSYKDTSQKFVLEPEDLGPDVHYRQYFLTYQTRIDLLYSRLLRQARKELGIFKSNLS